MEGRARQRDEFGRTPGRRVGLWLCGRARSERLPGGRWDPEGGKASASIPLRITFGLLEERAAAKQLPPHLVVSYGHRRHATNTPFAPARLDESDPTRQKRR